MIAETFITAEQIQLSLFHPRFCRSFLLATIVLRKQHISWMVVAKCVCVFRCLLYVGANRTRILLLLHFLLVDFLLSFVSLICGFLTARSWHGRVLNISKLHLVRLYLAFEFIVYQLFHQLSFLGQALPD